MQTFSFVSLKNMAVDHMSENQQLECNSMVYQRNNFTLYLGSSKVTLFGSVIQCDSLQTFCYVHVQCSSLAGYDGGIEVLVHL